MHLPDGPCLKQIHRTCGPWYPKGLEMWGPRNRIPEFNLASARVSTLVLLHLLFSLSEALWGGQVFAKPPITSGSPVFFAKSIPPKMRSWSSNQGLEAYLQRETKEEDETRRGFHGQGLNQAHCPLPFAHGTHQGLSKQQEKTKNINRNKWCCNLILL